MNRDAYATARLNSALDELIHVIDSAWPNINVHYQSQAESDKSKKPWVLCIDDDADLAEALQLRFASHGFEVARAYCGMTGFRYAFEFEPVAILLDLSMPGISGEELLHRLKANEATASIPIIIMTGMDQPGMKQRLLAAGASDFFKKPVPHNLLVEIVSYYSGGATTGY